MKRILTATLALSLMSTAALADGYYDRHGGGYGGGHSRGGGGNWVAPLVGGLIIGGMLGTMNNRYYQPYPAYHTECEMVPVFDRYNRYLGSDERCYAVQNY